MKTLFLALFSLLLAFTQQPSARADEVRRWTDAEFEAGRAAIKTEFVGHDETIDRVMDEIKPWFLFPEARLIPRVVILPGPTSVGKTSLINAIITYFKLQRDSQYFDMGGFADIEFKGDKNFTDALVKTYTTRPVDGDITLPEIQVPKNPVLVIDELQKIREFDDKGNKVERPNALGFWELLGNKEIKVPNPIYHALNMGMRSIIDWGGGAIGIRIPEELQGEAKKKEREEYYEKRFAAALSELKAKHQSAPPQISMDLKNSLIFVACNLEDVFRGSRVLNPDHLTADQLHELTATISKTDVKLGFGRLFRLEQVGRLGDRIVPVPSLSSKSFQALITMHLDGVRRLMSSAINVEAKFHPSVIDQIYESSVVPSLGPRPVIAAVFSFGLNTVGELVTAVKANDSYTAQNPAVVEIRVPKGGKVAVWEFKNGPLAGQKIEKELPQERKKGKSSVAAKRAKAIQIAHLAAHVVVYAKLLEIMPERVLTTSKASGGGGNIEFKDLPQAGRFVDERIDEIATLLAKRSADMLLFGEPSDLSDADLMTAIKRADLFVNESAAGRYGIENVEILVRTEKTERPPLVRQAEMDQVLDTAMGRAIKALVDERVFFTALIAKLQKTNELTRRQLKAMMQQSWSNPEEAKVLFTGRGRRVELCETLLKSAVANPEMLAEKAKQLEAAKPKQRIAGFKQD